MGWTSFNTQNYKNGKIDKEKTMTEELERSNHLKVLKSKMVGSTYYAACKTIKTGVVWGLVCLITTNDRDYYNFRYKDMDETMQPYYYKCPDSILDLLSPTDNEDAISWRKNCRKLNKEPSTIQKLNKLPIGSIISYENYDHETVMLQKCAADYQFKTPFWLSRNYRYMPKNRIPSNFKVVREGA